MSTTDGRVRLPVATAPSSRRRSARPFPAWLRLLDSCQRSLRRPLPIAVDLAVAGAAGLAVTASPGAAARMTATLLVTGLLSGLWKRRSPVQAQGVVWYMRRVTPGVVVAGAAMWAGRAVSGESAMQAAIAAGAALALTKSGMWLLVAAARRRGLGLSPTLVLGPESEVASAEYRVHLYPEAGLVCARSYVVRGGAPAGAARTRITNLLENGAIEHVLCTTGDARSDGTVRDVVRFSPTAVDVTVVQQGPLTGGMGTRLGDMGVVCLGRPSWGSEAGKRVFDLAVAVALLLAFSPLLLATALAIRLGDPGPAIFRQRRTGRYSRSFTIFKFRSMVEDAERLKDAVRHRNVADGFLFKADNDPRITRVGAWIRRFSIDELPQLFNVVKGDMSLVGPRPLPTVFDDSDVFARQRHLVLPGMTGLWQVKGANALPYDDMIDLDCAYVATRTLGLDLKILLQTLPAVLIRRSPY